MGEMRAMPVARIGGPPGRGRYTFCKPERATHVLLKMPGPFERRTIPIVQPGVEPHGEAWTWNLDIERPTLDPEITKTERGALGIPVTCIAKITDGKVYFSEDCTHDLAGTIGELGVY